MPGRRPGLRVAAGSSLPDGRFLFIQRSIEEDEPRQMHLILDAFAELEQGTARR